MIKIIFSLFLVVIVRKKTPSMNVVFVPGNDPSPPVKKKSVYSADGQQDKNFPVGTVGGHCFAAPSQVNYIIKYCI